MTDIAQAIRDNDANTAVTQILQGAGWAGNIGRVINQGLESTDPNLQRAAEFLRTGFISAVSAEKLELNAAAQPNGWSGIIQSLMGADGQFQFSDLMNADWGQILGAIMSQVFNGAAAGNDPAIAQHRADMDQAFQNAQAALAASGAAGADMRAELGGDYLQGVSAVVRQIDAVVPPPPAPAPS